MPVTAAVFITGMIGLGALFSKSNEEGYRSYLSRHYPPRPQGTYEVAGERVLIRDLDLDRKADTIEYLDRLHEGYVAEGFEKYLPKGKQMSKGLRHAASEVLREVDPSTEPFVYRELGMPEQRRDIIAQRSIDLLTERLSKERKN